MLFLVFTPLCVLVLRLQTRWRWKTIIWVSIVLGLAADFGGDLLVSLRR
jgi:hypothetical protein